VRGNAGATKLSNAQKSAFASQVNSDSAQADLETSIDGAAAQQSDASDLAAFTTQLYATSESASISSDYGLKGTDLHSVFSTRNDNAAGDSLQLSSTPASMQGGINEVTGSAKLVAENSTATTKAGVTISAKFASVSLSSTESTASSSSGSPLTSPTKPTSTSTSTTTNTPTTTKVGQYFIEISIQNLVVF